MLRKYVADSAHALPYKDLQLKEDLSYEEQTLKILARKVKSLRNRDIFFVKVSGKTS